MYLGSLHDFLSASFLRYEIYSMLIKLFSFKSYPGYECIYFVVLNIMGYTNQYFVRVNAC